MGLGLTQGDRVWISPSPDTQRQVSTAFNQKNVRHPNHHYLEYHNTPPICIAVRLQFMYFWCPYAVCLPFVLQYASHLYCDACGKSWCSLFKFQSRTVKLLICTLQIWCFSAQDSQERTSSLNIKFLCGISRGRPGGLSCGRPGGYPGGRPGPKTFTATVR